MGRDNLFQWEESNSLKHHCGVCDTPLSHPSAKTSCFGTHAEPCFRFHQFMFMRNRGHTCDMCIHIDEHHYKRHFEMCEHVRNIYESCGEDWPLIPEDEEERGRSMARNSDAFDSDGLSSTSSDIHLKKRDRKEQKRQIRAASRIKVVTQEDVKYIDSVLHPAAVQERTENPANPEEIEEIEQHLRYNAQCYNQGQKRSKLRQFARMPDADIDFGAEIDRVLDILRINGLVKRNGRNRGLRNKELANFTMLVSELKEQVITDLVQTKKDELEIRMRRAAFLRYTNRASYDIVTNRYADKDWKTGEKHRSVGSGSASSDDLTAVEEQVEKDDLADQNELRNYSTATLHDADRRHIEQPHKKVGSDRLLEEIVDIKEIRDPTIEPTPKLSPSLKIGNTNLVPPQKISFLNPWKKRNSSVTKPPEELKRTAQSPSSSELVVKDPASDEDNEWQTVGPTAIPKTALGLFSDARQPKSVLHLQTSKLSSSDAAPEAPWHALKPTRVGVTAWMDQGEIGRREMAQKLDGEEKQARLDAQAQIEERKMRLELAEARLQQQIEERKLQKLLEPTEFSEPSGAKHVAVESRKKKDKKKQRDTQRKARRAGEKESVIFELVPPSADGVEADSPAVEASPVDSMFCGGGLDPNGQDRSPWREGSTSEAEDMNLTDDSDGCHDSTHGDKVEEGNEHTVGAFQAKHGESPCSDLRLVPSSQDSWSVGVDPAPETSPKLSKDLSGHMKTTKGVASTTRKSVSFGPSKSFATIPTTKIGRHRDWLQQFTSATKVDNIAQPSFSPDHPAYKNTTTSFWWIGECPYEASGAPDCPYHRTYCKCVDPTDHNSFQHIVYADSYPCEIGPFNYMQGEKLMKFFETQPETKGKLMLVDEDLYVWLYTIGRHWRIESMTLKKLESTPMPKRLSWEVENFVRGFQKGRLLKQVELFQDLANHNERLASIGCRAKVTEQLLETLRKKRESGPANENICYCQDDLPEHPDEEDEFVECMFHDCPIQIFHRRCVEKVGYSKVTTWYCGYCEKYISLAAQDALYGAHAISMNLPLPDFEDGEMKGQMKYVAKRSDMNMVGHCERC